MREPDTSQDGEFKPDPVVVEWVANLAERVRAGESIDLAAVAAEHPDRAEVMRWLLPSMLTLAQFARSKTGQTSRNSFPGGRLTLGEFQFVREIGRGGMGVVYEAKQTSLKRRVALKVLPLATASNPRHFLRFQLEARAVACLRHEHIVPLYGVGCEDEIPYYAMQMIDGCSLAEVLKTMRKEDGVCLTHADSSGSDAEASASQPPTDPTSEFPAMIASEAGDSASVSPMIVPGIPCDAVSRRSRRYHRAVAGLGVQAARALHHAHENRIIHRDIKPSNLLIDRHGHLWVTDFGLAMILDDATLTGTGDLIGTLRYMSPEQALGNRGGIDGRTDVYSLGITLYELLTLWPAFGGTNRAEILHAIAHREPMAIRALSPSVPRDLETIVAKAIAKEPGDRYQTASDLADDLNRFLDGRPIWARRRSLVDRTTKLANRNRPVVIAALVMIVLGILSAAAELVWSNNWLLRHNEQLTLERNLNKALAQRAEANRLEAERQRDEADLQRKLSDQHLYGVHIRQAFDSLSMNQPERAQDILRDLAGSTQPVFPREFAWHYLWHRSRRDVVVLSATSEDVLLYVMSDDGRTLATYQRGGSVHVRDPDSGATRVKLSAHRFPIASLAISGDGRVIATGINIPGRVESEIALWNATTGHRLAGHVRTGTSVDGMGFDASGRHLWVESMGIGPGQPWSSEVWDLGDDALRPSLRRIGEWHRLAVSHNRRMAVVPGDDNRVVLLDLWTGTTRPLPKTDRVLSLAAVSSDGQRVAGQEEGSRDLVVWDVATCWEQARFQPSNMGHPTAIVFSDDNRTVGIRDDRGGFSTHDVGTGRNIAYPNEAVGPQTAVFSQMVFSPDGRTLALSYTLLGQPPMTPRLHDVETGKLLRTYPGRGERVGPLTFHPDGRSAFFGGRGQLYRWIVEPSPEPPQPAGHSDEAWCAAFTPDGRFLITGSDDTDDPLTLKVWDTRTAKFVRGWKPHAATVSSLAISPDGRVVATASLDQQGNLCLWDLASGRLIRDLEGHRNAVRSVAFSADGQILASAGRDGVIRLWNPSTGASLGVLEGHETMIRQVAFAPRGDLLASVGNDATLRLWNARTGTMQKMWRGANSLTAVMFAPDGKTIATTDIVGHVDIRDVETGEILQTMSSDDDELLDLAFSPDGRTLASAGRSHLIRVWDPRTGQDLVQLDGLRAQVNALAFSPDGTMLVSCSHDGKVHFWRGNEIPIPTTRPSRSVRTPDSRSAQ